MVADVVAKNSYNSGRENQYRVLAQTVGRKPQGLP